MNREQRRQQKKPIEMVDLRTITYPWQLSAHECESMAAMRLRDNLAETGHPFHHKTASGVIVAPDPTLEYYFSRLAEQTRASLRARYVPLARADAPAAVPVNRKFYGHDIYEGK